MLEDAGNCPWQSKYNVCDSPVAVCVGRASVENLARSCGEAKGLHQSLETREWSRVRCCGVDDAVRVAGAV